MWEQNYTPVAGSLGLSTLVAAIPLVILFYMLGIRRKPGWVAGLSALGAAARLVEIALALDGSACHEQEIDLARFIDQRRADGALCHAKAPGHPMA